MTEVEIKTKFIDGMSEELGTSFFAMYKELVWTSKKWDEYQDLFLTNETRINLINKSAPLFFSIIRDSLENDILLSISRLTDPPTTGKFKNASLRRALPHIENSSIQQKLSDELTSLEDTVKSIRDKRNKNISHIDFDNLFQEPSKTIIEVSYSEIEDALNRIQKVFNSIEKHFCDSSTIFKHFPSMAGSYELLRIIDLGLELEGLNEQKLRDGQFSMKDIKNRDI